VRGGKASLYLRLQYNTYSFIKINLIVRIRAGDPDPDRQVPHVFGPPGSISQRYGSGSGSFPLSEIPNA
jgi:hypothetical protein